MARRMTRPDGTHWVSVRDWLEMMGLFLRPNGTPDTNRCLKMLPPGYVLYEPMRQAGRMVVVAFADEGKLIELFTDEEEADDKSAEDVKDTKIKKLTIVEHFGMQNAKRSAVIRADKELRHAYCAERGLTHVEVKSGLTLFPTDFLEGVTLEAIS